jgi:hypothetical protein
MLLIKYNKVMRLCSVCIEDVSFDPVRSATLFIALHNTGLVCERVYSIMLRRARGESQAAFYARAYLHTAVEHNMGLYAFKSIYICTCSHTVVALCQERGFSRRNCNYAL